MRDQTQSVIDRREAITLAAVAATGLVLPKTHPLAEEAETKAPSFDDDVIIVGGGHGA